MGSWSAVLHAEKGCAMRSKLGWGFVGAALMVGMLPSPIYAQEEGGAPTLTVVGLRYTDAQGNETSHFAQGEEAQAFLRLLNSGTEPVTGITGTLEFGRGFVEGGTDLSGGISWPDLAPGESAENTEPFRFRWGEANDDPDFHSCGMFLDGLDVAPEEVVDEPIEDEFELQDPASDPSDSAAPIPPASLVFLISTEQGDFTHHAFAGFVCAAGFSPEDGAGDDLDRPKVLATTGASQPLVALLGAGFLVAGGALRRRARIAPALQRR